MQVHLGIDILSPEWQRAVVTIGTYDGVHLGHESVIRTAASLARERELPLILVTFDRHPSTVLRPESAPKPITSLKMNLERFQGLEVGLVAVIPFNAWMSRMSAQSFLDQVLCEKLRAQCLVVGHDFALGNNREGGTEWLKERIETVIVPPFEVDGIRVSSTAIRRALQENQLGLANRLLGRPFEIQGFVDHGQKLGRTLGYPTANIARSFDQVMPADGVYAARFLVSGQDFAAALAIGTRPAAGGGPRSIEAFLLDYPGGSLYGQHTRLRLEKFLRPEQNFSTLEALKTQMALDVAAVREMYA